jgi:hypothetical protein
MASISIIYATRSIDVLWKWTQSFTNLLINILLSLFFIRLFFYSNIINIFNHAINLFLGYIINH